MLSLRGMLSTFALACALLCSVPASATHIAFSTMSYSRVPNAVAGQTINYKVNLEFALRQYFFNENGRGDLPEEGSEHDLGPLFFYHAVDPVEMAYTLDPNSNNQNNQPYVEECCDLHCLGGCNGRQNPAANFAFGDTTACCSQFAEPYMKCNCRANQRDAQPRIEQIRFTTNTVVESTNTDPAVQRVENYILATDEMEVPIDVRNTVFDRTFVVFDVCCRLSTVRDDNNDVYGRMIMSIDPVLERSHKTTGAARIFGEVGRPMPYTVPVAGLPGFEYYFEIPGLNVNGGPTRDTDVTRLQSSLIGSSVPINTGPNPSLTMSPTTGRVSWIPSTQGLYAFQVRIYEGNYQGSAPSASGFNFAESTGFIPLDFLFEIFEACLDTDTDCNHAPFFFDPETSFRQNFFRGVEGTFNLNLDDLDEPDILSLLPGVLPTGATIIKLTPDDRTKPAIWKFRWTPAIDQTSAVVCFQGRDNQVPSRTTLGNYCVNLDIGDASLIYISGVIRDFKKDHVDFFLNEGDNDRDNNNQFVAEDLGSDNKPVFSGSARTVSGANSFNQWYNDVEGINQRLIFSVVMSNGTEEDGRVFTFLSTILWPIDNILFGNENDLHNNYYTYEINTYVIYLGEEQYSFKASDDLWLFIKRKLIPGWNLQGVHTFKEQIVVMDDLAVADGFDLVLEEFYRTEIFYAHRGTGGRHEPGLQLQLPEAILCNALNNNADDQPPEIDFAQFSAQELANDLVARSVTVGQGSLNANRNQNVLFMTRSNSGLAAAHYAYYAREDPLTPEVKPESYRLKVLQGFGTEFTFRWGGECEGFAFVIQAQSPTAVGQGGSGLGYKGITNSLAIEFDGQSQAALNDPSYDHTSLHTLWELENDNQESASLGRSAPEPFMDFKNGSLTSVFVEYVPARDTEEGDQFGFIRVYFEGVVAPVMQAQVNGIVIRDAFQAGSAYAGFTAGTSSNRDLVNDIMIENWSMTIVPPAATTTSLDAAPLQLVAGLTGKVVIIARDSCGNRINISEEADAARYVVNIQRKTGDDNVFQGVVTNNGDGTFDVEYRLTKTGTYRFEVLFDGVPIKDTPTELVVVPAPTDPLVSSYVYGKLPTTYSNEPLPGPNAAPPADGMQMVVVDSTMGTVVSQEFFDINTGAGQSAFVSAMNAVEADQIVALACKGDCSDGATGATNTAAQSIGATEWLSMGTDSDKNSSYAIIGVKEGGNLNIATVEAFTRNDTTPRIQQEFPGSPDDDEDTFFVFAQSGGPSYGQFSRINVEDEIIFVNAGGDSNFDIIARDEFGNLQTQQDQFALTFAPGIDNRTQPARQGSTAFYDTKWDTTVAGPYQMYVRLNGAEVSRSPRQVIVVPAAADNILSLASGAGLASGEATVPTSFEMSLKDRFGNILERENPNDPDDISCTLTGPTTLPVAERETIDGEGRFENKKFLMTYVGTKAGPYDLECIINGGVAEATLDKVVEIVPGPTALATSEASGTGISGAAPGTAGDLTTFTIQSVDAAENVRNRRNPNGDFDVSFVPAVEEPSVQYTGDGAYTVSFLSTVATTYAVTVTYEEELGMPGPIERPSQPMSLVINPNVVAAPSTIEDAPTTIKAGETGTYGILPRDEFDNVIKPGDTTYDATAVVAAFSGVGAGGGIVRVRDLPITEGNGDNFEGSIVPSLVGDYTLSVSVKSSGDVVGEVPITVTPAITDCDKTKGQVSGPGIAGGVSGDATSLIVQSRDRFENNQDGSNPDDAYTLTITYDGATTEVQGVKVEDNGFAGQYILEYTVPTLASANQNTYQLSLVLAPDCVIYTKEAFIEENLADTWAAPEDLSYRTARAGEDQTWTLIAYNTEDLQSTELTPDLDFVVELTRDDNGQTRTITGITATQQTELDKFTVTYNPSSIGTFTMRVLRRAFAPTVQSTVAGTSAPTFDRAVEYALVVIGPGTVNPPASGVTGLPATTTAGVEQTFTVSPTDKFGNSLDEDGRTITAVMTAPGADDVTVVGVYTAGGDYVFTYDIEKAAVYTVAITDDEAAVNALGLYSGAPLTLTITPDVVDAAMSEVTGIGAGVPTSPLARDPVAGDVTSYRVVTKDQFGNLANDDSITFTTDLSAGAAPIVSQNPDPASFYLGNSVYQVSYSTNVASTNSVFNDAGNVFTVVPQLTANGQPPAPVEQDLTVTIVPARVDEATSTVVLAEPTSTAGEDVVLTLETKDGFGNEWKTGNPTDTFQLIRTLATSPDSNVFDAVVVAGPASTFTITLKGEDAMTGRAGNTRKAGDYELSFFAEGQPFTPATLPTVTVVAAETDPASTEVPGTIDRQTIDVLFDVSITTSDRFGNPILRGTPGFEPNTDVVEFNFISGAYNCPSDIDLGRDDDENDPADIFFKNEDVASTGGEYDLAYAGEKAGVFTLNITINGEPLPCQKIEQLNFRVDAGQPDADRSSLVGPTDSVAGARLAYRIDVRDKYGNVVTDVEVSDFSFGGDVADFPAENDPVDDQVPAFELVSFKNSTFQLRAAPTVAQDYNLIARIGLSPSGEILVNNANNTRVLTVIAAEAFSFNDIEEFSAIAGVPTSFDLDGTDRYGNSIKSNLHFYDVKFTYVGGGAVDDLVYTVQGVVTNATDAQGNIRGGIHRVDVTPAWAGDYSLEVTLLTAVEKGVRADTKTITVTVSHQTCAADNGDNLAYRCPPAEGETVGQCVGSYDECPNINACPDGQVKCTDGQCVGLASDCPCPAGQSRCKTRASADFASGPCVADQQQCPIAAECPSNAPHQCMVMKNGQSAPTGDCRLTAEECPSPVNCAPGYVICSDGRTCVREGSNDCPEVEACPDGKIQCSTGVCVAQVQDCPSRVTCKEDGYIVCATDGSCQPDASMCPDQYPCYGEGAERCFDGSCRINGVGCPSPVVCPPGFVLCENNQCAGTRALCPDVPVCPLSQVRCPDGSCQENTLLCPSQVSCNDQAPVKCADGSCAKSIFDCGAVPTCKAATSDSEGEKLCSDGSCVGPDQDCPTVVTCPADYPVLCADKSCQRTADLCPVVPKCPPEAPLRCASGSCRGSFADCPDDFSCPANQPVRCADRQCKVAVDNCPSPELLRCGPLQVKCPTGECVEAYSLCPTHVSCPSGSQRCRDGTCREECPVTSPECPSTLVLCPQAGSGVSCAKSIDKCPQNPVCPDTQRVRCIDAGCAVDVDSCPPVPAEYPEDKIPCPGGSWAQDCPTPVTCPPDYPFKCYDDTCRIAPEDCPVAPACPVVKTEDSIDNVYLCPNGNCVPTLWNDACIDANNLRCDTARGEVKCADGTCATSVDKCPDIVPEDCAGDECLDELPVSGCPVGRVRCRDGSCKSDPEECVPLRCPTSEPFACKDGNYETGQCVTSIDKCDDIRTGCPWDQPDKCWDGSCVAEGECPAPPCQFFCNDGTGCVDSEADLVDCNSNNQNGCQNNEIRCADKRCYLRPTNDDEPSPCTLGASENADGSVPNACPYSHPFRCPDGYCALSSVKCPVSSSTEACPKDRPFRCADGQCRLQGSQCQLVTPCKPNEVRCGDATCKFSSSSCPVFNSCPESTPFRCRTGLCAETEALCLDEETGCPGGFDTKCPSGACIDSSGAVTCEDTVLNPTGCPTGKVRCPNGACEDTEDLCLTVQGCAKGEFKCPFDGACVRDPDTCVAGTPADCAAPNTICADNTCRPGTECPTISQCPASAPVRCANGECKKYGANSGVPGESCTAVVLCPSGTAICYDGQCKAAASQCPSVPVCGGTTPFQCPGTLQCVASEDACPADNTVCPPSQPTLCNNGQCTAGPQFCPATPTNPNQPIDQPVSAPTGTEDEGCTFLRPRRCFDGSCASSYAGCLDNKAATEGNGSNGPDAVESLCEGKVTCPSGECVQSADRCAIIARCPAGYTRCEDGECILLGGGNSCGATAACSAGLTRCEDGACRTECLPFNGCPLSLPYHCPNRACATSESTCPTEGPRATPGRRLLQTQAKEGAKPCTENCRAEVQPENLAFTIDVKRDVVLDIAVDSARNVQGQLVVPSGAMLDEDPDKTLSQLRIAPVAESRIRDAVNIVELTRRDVFGNSMPFQETLLSPAFECFTEPTIQEPFNVNLTYTANIDIDRDPLFNPTSFADVCLAYVFTDPVSGFSAWRCENKAQQTLASAFQVNGAVQSCANEDGTIYGMAHVPAKEVKPPIVPDKPFPYLIVILVIIGVIGFIALAFYVCQRLFRYRKKYIEERAAVDRMQDLVDTKNQFGGAAGEDDDEVMTDNPLVMQVQDVQRRLADKDLELEAEKREQAEAESDARQLHIGDLKDDRNELQAQLDALKAQLASQQAGRPAAAVVPQAAVSTGVDAGAASANVDFESGGGRSNRRRDF